MKCREVEQRYDKLIYRYWPRKYCQLDLVSVIVRECGWLPLRKDESMKVSIQDKRYEIKRIDNLEAKK